VDTVRPGGIVSLHTDGLEGCAGTRSRNLNCRMGICLQRADAGGPIGHTGCRHRANTRERASNFRTIAGPLELTGSGTIIEVGTYAFMG